MVCGEMPKRAAWSRLTAIVSCGALAKRSLDASVSCGSVLSFSSILTDHSFNSAMLESCNVYWKLPRAGRPPTVMSCVGCRKRLAPPILASLGRSRSMTCDAVDLRCSRGFNAMKARPVFAVLAKPPVLPVIEPMASTSGSCRTISFCSCIRRIIWSGEALCAASENPVMTPMSWIGKKPFGLSTIMTTVSAMVAKNTPSVIA